VSCSTRQLFNKAKRTGDLGLIKDSLHLLRPREIRKTKWFSWRDYCQGIDDLPDRPDSSGSWLVSWPKEWDLLNHTMDNTHDLEKRPGGKYTEFL